MPFYATTPVPLPLAICWTELARGRDRLAGKRLVVWEFAVRELATGNWDFLPLKIPERASKLSCARIWRT